MTTFWFIVLSVLWAGFLILEGFDFGVGALQRFLAPDETSRSEVIATIGPVWDGNEVWLITAGAATFAAFPGWYATMFSGYYLAFLLLLVALILRGVAIEFRGKHDSPRWRRNWSLILAGASLVAPLVIGVALADLLYGVPIDAQQEYAGSFWDLFSGYSLLAGVMLVLLTLLHGAAFLGLKTEGATNQRARRTATVLAPLAAVAVVGMIIWTHTLTGGGALASIMEALAFVAVVAAVWLARTARVGLVFAATTVTIAAVVFSLFANLYPRVMVSSLGAANDLTTANTSSAPYSLKVMTVVLAIFLPVVLVYQGWTYYVFRRRLTQQPQPTT